MQEPTRKGPHLRLDGSHISWPDWLTAPQRKLALTYAAVGVEVDRWIQAHIGRPEPDVPDWHGRKPHVAARALRMAWKLGSRPLPNLVQLFEAHGVRLYALVSGEDRMDACSLWHDGVPFIFVHPMQPSYEKRIAMARELGHVVLHRHVRRLGKREINAANIFARAFALPERQMLPARTQRYEPFDLMLERHRYGVTGVAYATRMYEVRHLTYHRYRTLRADIQESEELSRRKLWGAHEHSTILTQAFNDTAAGEALQARMVRGLHLRTENINIVAFGFGINDQWGDPSYRIPRALPHPHKHRTRRLVR